MSEVRRYVLAAGRELRTLRARGQFVIALHDTSTMRVVSLTIRPGELGALRRALSDLASSETAGRKHRPPPAGVA